MHLHLVLATMLSMNAARAAQQATPAAADPTPAATAAAPATAPAARPGGPVLRGSSAAAVAPEQRNLVVFKGTMLLNEFVYRTLLKLPAGATATPQTARSVATQLAAFLRDAGYDLAKVRAAVKGEQIEVQIDEGALDKIIISGTGWLTALRFRAALNLPLDVFNRRLFELQLPRLQRQFGLRGYEYELWPVHLIDTDNAAALDDLDELRAMPLLRRARGYELRIYAATDPWSSGFSPEVVINSSTGVGLGGRYRWKNLLQEGDRWSTHFRVGAASRGYLDAGGGSRIVNSNDLLDARWLSRPWGGSSQGLRMTIAPRLELWSLQRKDLMLERYDIGTLELGTGAGAQLSPQFALYFTVGLQRRWIFAVEPARGTSLAAEVTRVPGVSNRGFLRATSQYTADPEELRQDLRSGLSLELNASRPISAADSGFFRFDLQGRRLFAFGWNELRAGARVGGEVGDVAYLDEIPLEDYLRIGFGLERYTRRVAALSLEFRYSLLRDKIKVGAFTDLGAFRRLPREDPQQSAALAGSTGAGLFFFVFDELQIDACYGLGWATDGYTRTGLSLQIKEAF